MAELKELYEQDSLKKTLLLTDGEVELTDKNIISEEFSIEQVICDENQLKIGTCNAATLKMKIYNNVVPLKNRGLEVSQTIEGSDEIQKLGKFYIYSDKPTADRNYRDIIAYDRMHYIMNKDVKEWYENVKFPCKLKNFRDSFFSYMETQQEAIVLVNDEMTVEKTIDTEEISGRMVIEAICAINGCFGQIGYDGIFHYVRLQTGLFPDVGLFPGNDVYPGQSANKKGECNYISCQYEDYTVQQIDCLQIRQEEDDIGVVVGDPSGNTYIMEDNFLLYGKSPDELYDIANNLFSVIKDIRKYQPFECVCKGNPTRTIGTAVTMYSNDKVIETYILKRTIEGVQSLKDTYSAKGNEYYDKKVNGVNKSNIILKKRVNKLIRTVDENKLEISRVETNLVDNYSTTEQMNSAISQSATAITLSVSKTLESYSTTEQMNSAISVSATGIKTDVSNTYETKDNASSNYDTLSTSINQNANAINLKANKNGIIGEINVSPETIKISANRLELTGIATFMSELGYVTEDDLGVNGTTVINGGRIDTESLFARAITASNLKLTGSSSLQLGATNIENKQYIYLVGTNNETVYETGLFPSRFYTISDDGYSMNITANTIAFGTSKGNALNISTDVDGVVWYSAGLSHEFMGDMVSHNRLMYIAGNAYHDIIKIIKNNIILGNLIDYTEG